MSTVGGVNELVQALQLALSHDPECSILPLYAPLIDAEKIRVTSCSDPGMFPGNSGKRLICVATNIADAGITIPGKHFRPTLDSACGLLSSNHFKLCIALLLNLTV